MTDVYKAHGTDDLVIHCTQQEAALVSLLLGCTPSCGPGDDLFEALCKFFPMTSDPKGTGSGSPRDEARRVLPVINTMHPEVLVYLSQYPGGVR